MRSVMPVPLMLPTTTINIIRTHRHPTTASPTDNLIEAGAAGGGSLCSATHRNQSFIRIRWTDIPARKE